MALPLPLDIDITTSYADDDELITKGAAETPSGLVNLGIFDNDTAREAGWKADIRAQLYKKLYAVTGPELDDWLQSLAEDQVLLGALGDTLRITLTVTRNPL